MCCSVMVSDAKNRASNDNRLTQSQYLASMWNLHPYRPHSVITWSVLLAITQTHHGSSLVASRTLASISLMFNTTFFAFITTAISLIHILLFSLKAHLIIVAFQVIHSDLRELTRKRF